MRRKWHVRGNQGCCTDRRHGRRRRRTQVARTTGEDVRSVRRHRLCRVLSDPPAGDPTHRISDADLVELVLRDRRIRYGPAVRPVLLLGEPPCDPHGRKHRGGDLPAVCARLVAGLGSNAVRRTGRVFEHLPRLGVLGRRQRVATGAGLRSHDCRRDRGAIDQLRATRTVRDHTAVRRHRLRHDVLHHLRRGDTCRLANRTDSRRHHHSNAGTGGTVRSGGRASGRARAVRCTHSRRSHVLTAVGGAAGKIAERGQPGSAHPAATRLAPNAFRADFRRCRRGHRPIARYSKRRRRISHRPYQSLSQTSTSDVAPQAYPADAVRAIGAALAEAMRNSLRHAGPSNRSVTVRTQPGILQATVTDDGVGFDRASVPPHRLGVAVSIEGRLRQLPGGASRIDSIPGQGTTVHLTWCASDVPRTAAFG